MKSVKSDTPILVTGGAGYIGSHICKALSKKGFLPISYDNLITGHAWAVKWGPLEVGNTLDKVRLSDVLAKYKPVAVIHCAAFAYVGESVFDPTKYYQNNVVGTLSLLDCMRQFNINKIIFSSTCATYGMPKELPLSEQHSQTPINPYGMSKLMVEQILSDFDIAYNLRSICLRYFNASGADVDSEIGEMHDPETHLIPLILDVANNCSSTLKVYGNDYDTPDGSCIRDYIHVSDLADAHVLSLQALLRNSKSDVFNLSNGNGFSVFEILRVAQDITNREIQFEVVPRRKGDPAILVGDSSKIRNKLGWEPKFKDIKDILATAWSWSTRHERF